ncbi:MAG: signal peptide peptidase SppA [Deltaproteobacteria bacterium]|nr:signal peptide peptidase SppA [Deltaproteobacteria bacterium]
MKKWVKRIAVFFLLVLALMGVRSLFRQTPSFGKSLGVLEIEGTMWTGDAWVEQIEDFRKDSRIHGVVVRIQSPGGTVAAAQEIFEAIKNLGEMKPVVASMGTLAASGGLYVALAAPVIFADPGTITGSIGVKMEHVQVTDLLATLGVKYETIKSGRLKDLASPVRAMSAEERALIEAMMTEIHEQFKEVVASARNIEKEKLQTIADGRIFTGAKALEFGLVDQLGGFLQAVKVAAEKAGIEGEPKLIYGGKGRVWWMKAFLETARAYLQGPLACYLYP